MKKMALFLSLACLFCVLGTAHAGEKAVLRFCWWGSSERHEATLKAFELYEKENPDVTIKAEYIGWGGYVERLFTQIGANAEYIGWGGYVERLFTQIGANAEPDIMQMDWAWLALFSKTGDGFYDLLSLKDVVNLDAYEQKWLDTCMVNGKLNALPVSFTTRFFVWNKTTWDRAGVPLPKTWDDIANAGPVFLEKLGGEYYPLDVTLSTITHMLGSYIFQKTGKMVIDPKTHQLGLDRDELREFFAYYKRLVDNHAITPLSYRAARSGDAEAPTHEQSDYIEGRWCGSFNWDANLTLLINSPLKEFTFSLGEFPTQDGAKNSGRIGRPSQIFAVSKNSKHPRAAAALVSFLLTSPEAAKVLKTTRGVLLADGSFQTLKDNDLIHPLNVQALEQLSGVDVYSPSPYFEDPRMLELINEQVEKVGYGKVTPEEAAGHLEVEIPRLLRRLLR